LRLFTLNFGLNRQNNIHNSLAYKYLGSIIICIMVGLDDLGVVHNLEVECIGYRRGVLGR